MKISILTLFPQMFAGPFQHSIIKRAQEKGKVEIELVDIREFGIGSHKMVDDTPYGGGVGMVLKIDVVHKALEHVKKSDDAKVKQRTILTTASGRTYNQSTAQQYTKIDHLIIICGHYEGIDDRISNYIDEEISIGDFVLTGGEIPAMLITDSVTRLIDGVITDGATEDESFSETNHNMLEYPHYTKPRSYDGHDVPEVLLSGDHQKIADWRHKKSFEKTELIRPDLIKTVESQNLKQKR